MTKIIIVEDERMIAEDIKNSLISMGYEVVAIYSCGEDVLAQLSGNEVDVILLDIMLDGDLTGIDTARLINKRYDIPIIFLTAYADNATINNASAVKPYAYILKPFDAKELNAAIEITLVKHSAERKLKISNKKYESLFKGNPEPSVYLDPAFKIVDINPMFSNCFGYTLDEVVGKSIDELIIPPGMQKEASALSKQSSDNNVYKDAFRKRKDGSLVPVSISAAPIIIDGIHTGTFVIYKDISAQKKAEDEREKVISDLQKALAEVETLSGMIPMCSHCKKVRDDEGFWDQVEDYIAKRSNVDFSHGICPDCLKKYYPKIHEKMQKNKDDAKDSKISSKESKQKKKK